MGVDGRDNVWPQNRHEFYQRSMKFCALVPFHLFYQIKLRCNQDFSRRREKGVIGRDMFLASEQRHH